MWAIFTAIWSVVLTLEIASRFSVGEFLSFGVSQSICKSQQIFANTGKTVNPVKERPKGQSEKCLWYQKNPNCSPGSSCSVFSVKTCHELGLAENQISRSNIAPKIVGGNEVEPPHKYPSYARIIGRRIPKNPENETEEDFRAGCGSVILSQEWILTAAHCSVLDSENEEARYETRYLAGRHNFTVPEEDEQIVRPVEGVEPPNVTDAAGNYIWIDLILIKVQPPFKFNDQISPVKLPKKSYNIPGESAVIMGVGYKDVEDIEYEDLPDVPSEAEISVIDRETCRNLSGSDPKEINEYKICFHRDEGFVGPCNGDSGSPAYALDNGEQILIGILSSGTTGDCSGPNAAGVYMDVFYMIDWIRKITGITA